MPKQADSKPSSFIDYSLLVKNILEELNIGLEESKEQMDTDETYQGRYRALSELKCFINGYLGYSRYGSE